MGPKKGTCMYVSDGELVSFLDPTTHTRKGSGDIGADSWFCKLSNHVIICIYLYRITCSHMMVCKTKKMLQNLLTLSHFRVGSGNETNGELVSL